MSISASSGVTDRSNVTPHGHATVSRYPFHTGSVAAAHSGFRVDLGNPSVEGERPSPRRDEARHHHAKSVTESRVFRASVRCMSEATAADRVPKMLPLPEVAKALRCSVRSLYSSGRVERLGGVKVGKSVAHYIAILSWRARMSTRDTRTRYKVWSKR
jgi:hypothetical protein